VDKLLADITGSLAAACGSPAGAERSITASELSFLGETPALALR
jgi:hypothetical protein